MNLRLDKIREDQQLLTLIGLLIAVFFLTLSYLKTSAESRPSIQGSSQLRIEIQAMKSDIQAMSRKKRLDKVEAYWIALFDTAAQSGLELKNAQIPADQRYQGPLQSKTGILEGPTPVVLSTLSDLHEHLPIFLYSVKIKGHLAEVTLSVVGV